MNVENTLGLAKAPQLSFEAILRSFN